MENSGTGSLIARRRKSIGMTQRQLAEKLFVTDKAVSKRERGVSLPDVALLPRLSDLLGVTVDEPLCVNGAERRLMCEVMSDLQAARGSSGKKRRMNTARLVSGCLTLLFLVGIVACVICDLATSGKLTWSYYPIASIVFAWVVIAPFLFFREKRIWRSVLQSCLICCC